MNVPYLSLIRLNPLRRQARSLLGNPQRMHAALLGGLPIQPVEERTLWRLDHKGHAAELLALTAAEPSWEHLVEQAGWPSSADGQAHVRPLEPLLAQLNIGREFHFRAKLNTTRVSHQGGLGGRGVRVGVNGVAEQLTWFLERAGTGGRWGFAVEEAPVPSVRVVERENLRFSRRAGEPPVSLATATFEGTLRVTDSSAMRSSLVQGLGRGKAYGCGLLTLAPVR